MNKKQVMIRYMRNENFDEPMIDYRARISCSYKVKTFLQKPKRHQSPLATGFLCLLFLPACFVPLLDCDAQGVNDNIGNRLELKLDGDYFSSSTAHSTVEWDCINKSLTRKCLQYHNDQWFTFQVPTAGKYYLNIVPGECRDALGIQAIVIEGNPCEITTYKILWCIPRISGREIFIALDSITPNTPYLVNIDGFLGDICKFDIQLATKPYGLPVNAKNTNQLNLTSENAGKIVVLSWEVPASLTDEMISFEIFRISESRRESILIRKMPLIRNAIGAVQRAYDVTDTVAADGAYIYQILGLFRSGIKEILDEQRINLGPAPTATSDQMLNVPLEFKNGTPVQVLLIDAETDRVLKQTSFAFDRKKDSPQRIYVGQYIEKGVSRFLVRVVDLNDKRRLDYGFDVVREGTLNKIVSQH